MKTIVVKQIITDDGTQLKEGDSIRLHTKNHPGTDKVYAGTISSIFGDGFFLDCGNVSHPFSAESINFIKKLSQPSDYPELNDSTIEELWEEFKDIPYDNGRLLIDWMFWHKGTPMTEVRYWFHEHHSKGVDWLMTCRNAKTLESEKAGAFEIDSIVRYGEERELSLGRAVVLMNRKGQASKIDFIYETAEDEWMFYYENGTCLNKGERMALENWFVAQMEVKQNTPKWSPNL